ncbi:hypothetical protein [Bradyrhizobium sp. 186]|nr:hypothetical protein [Bradyrhizobium sp. 186]
MEQEATNRGAVYPWHMDRGLRKSAPFADAVREIVMKQLAEPAEV